MNWLKKKREEKNLTQKKLAKETGVNIFTIQNIEQGTRKGSEETLKILNDYFENGTTSYESDDLIEELESDIEEFGEDQILYAMFENIDGYLALTNYDFITKEEPLTKEEKDSYCLVLELKACDILKLLKLQNKVL